MKYLLFIVSMIPAAAIATTNQYFYLSGDTGIFQAIMNQDYQDETDVIGNNIEQPVDQNGYTVGVALGYKYQWRTLYSLGAELSGNLDTQNATYKNGAAGNAFSDATKLQYHVDLTIVPGINLTDTVLGYLKLGVSYASIRDEVTSPTGVFANYVDFNARADAIGFAAGLGVSKEICKHFLLFTEANYHDYGSVDFDDFENFSATYSHSTHVYSYDVVVGATYKFV